MIRRLPRKGERSRGTTVRDSHLRRPQRMPGEVKEENISTFRELVVQGKMKSLVAKVRESRGCMSYFEELLSKKEEAFVRQRTADALAELAREGTDISPVLTALEEAFEDPLMKRSAVRAAAFYYKRVVDLRAIQRLLTHEDKDVRDEAVVAVN